MIRFFALALIFFALSAQAYTGSELLEDCRAAETLDLEKKSSPMDEPPRAARCLAYVNGFADGYGIADYLAGQVGVQLSGFCLPVGDDRQFRLVRAVVSHLERQPPNTTASTRTLVAGALSKAFPCTQ